MTAVQETVAELHVQSGQSSADQSQLQQGVRRNISLHSKPIHYPLPNRLGLKYGPLAEIVNVVDGWVIIRHFLWAAGLLRNHIQPLL